MRLKLNTRVVKLEQQIAFRRGETHNRDARRSFFRKTRLAYRGGLVQMFAQKGQQRSWKSRARRQMAPDLRRIGWYLMRQTNTNKNLVFNKTRQVNADYLTIKVQMLRRSFFRNALNLHKMAPMVKIVKAEARLFRSQPTYNRLVRGPVKISPLLLSNGLKDDIEIVFEVWYIVILTWLVPLAVIAACCVIMLSLIFIQMAFYEIISYFDDEDGQLKSEFVVI